ncbi:MAG TPA: metal ABC transporter permease [Planctomycetota bacterium]|jgi:ABC-type Mn2+/Zn2+ transport system permease subunit
MDDLSYIDALRATPLLQRAVIAGALAGVCCAALSPLVVLRRMAFVGDGMAHAAFGGIGIALFVLAGAEYDSPAVQVLTLLFVLALAAGIGIVSRRPERAQIAEDSAIGIAFSVSMALGALFIRLRQNRSPQYVTSMDVFLFGSLWNISASDVIAIAIVTLTVLLVMILLQKEMLFYAFDAQLAEASGLNVGVFHYLFLILLVLTVVQASRVMGIVLVSASLVLPGVAALRVCRRLAPAMLFAAGIGIASFELGMYASYRLDVHPGSTIVLIQFALLLISASVGALKQRGKIS